jgi:methylase of polypeptide subunit release factors
MKVQATLVLTFQAKSLEQAGAVLDDVLAYARERDDVEVGHVEVRRGCRLQAPSATRPSRASRWHRGRFRSSGAMNYGWFIPPASLPVKSDETLLREREAKIEELARRGLLRSERLRRAMLGVLREDFIPSPYRDHAYEEVPLPLPGDRATISCPHSYPLFYEPLGLGHGHRFLEVGVGSGYGTALAREVVGREGLAVAIDIDATTLAFARKNLERAGYTDVIPIHGDGDLGTPSTPPTIGSASRRPAPMSRPR